MTLATLNFDTRSLARPLAKLNALSNYADTSYSVARTSVSHTERLRYADKISARICAKQMRQPCVKPLKITLSHQALTLDFADEEVCLLDVLHKNDIFVEYQCKEGYCGSCRTQLVSGDVEYLQKPLAFISQNEILPCCCKPVSDIELAI